MCGFLNRNNPPRQPRPPLYKVKRSRQPCRPSASDHHIKFPQAFHRRLQRLAPEQTRRIDILDAPRVDCM
jgi:hypothetical protein